jgi:hypothetical protein
MSPVGGGVLVRLIWVAAVAVDRVDLAVGESIAGAEQNAIVVPSGDQAGQRSLVTTPALVRTASVRLTATLVRSSGAAART